MTTTPTASFTLHVSLPGTWGTALTRTSTLVKLLTHFCHVIDRPAWRLFNHYLIPKTAYSEPGANQRHHYRSAINSTPSRNDHRVTITSSYGEQQMDPQSAKKEHGSVLKLEV